ncbi:MAG: methyltransferase domain-containing protein [Nitrospirae bacterium]|nr:methyltransferase domain-containing protein [Nitrospirota bacterium]
MYLVAHHDFTDLAASYDAWYQTPLGAFAHALEQEAIFGLADVTSGERVVDIGCGTGIYALELARRGLRVVGLDVSFEMLAIAREKCRSAGLTGLWVCGSAEALPFRSASADLALAVTSLCFVAHPDRAVEEMGRVIAPDGRVVLGELNRWSSWALVRRLKGLVTDTIYNRAHFWSRRELERLLRRNRLAPRAVHIVLHIPPIRRITFLKYARVFDSMLRRLLPWTGAFIAVAAERPSVEDGKREGKPEVRK